MCVDLLDLLRRRVAIPQADIPSGRLVDLPGRGTTFVTDTPGPHPDAPTVLLLHGLATTGLLTWYPAIAPLSERYRVVTMDQRWHGQGIVSEHFSLPDCADDVAALVDLLELGEVILVGYSFGSIVAQRVWRQHPGIVAGLVLCATTDRFRSTVTERVFHDTLRLAMTSSRRLARSRVAVHAARQAARVLDLQAEDLHAWALREFRSTSGWALGPALAALGRHHSRPWLGQIDVPTAVVIGLRDRVFPPADQVALARRIPGATIHEVEAGHAGCVFEADAFVAGVLEALATVNARQRDRAG
ncbi:alpha/beta fold hydrolase [Nocardioides sp.]|uniref:alpha/beta fold hydrolase n=1 Tax=Nocardioides sp. TaxID=35761 RepID=UPI00273253FA|nr:alpha/beta hydrolase [Nocardioides sp.]MDP3893730.1 alpha/beta hydrolase [Nocardioides sp.]